MLERHSYFAVIRNIAVALALCGAVGNAAAQLVIGSARVWPAPEYTRVALEAAAPIKYRHLLLANPTRLALDLEGATVDHDLDGLANKVQADDPHIKAIRVGRFKPNVMRIVFELKTEVKPNVFLLDPAGTYGYRLVLDFYPVTPTDPLMLLLEREAGESSADAKAEGNALTPSSVAREATTGRPVAKSETSAGAKGASTPAPATTKVTLRDKLPGRRPITVAIDAGHGGEDPGASGANGTQEKEVTLAVAKRLKAVLDEEPDMRGVLIRDADYFIPLAHRVHKARRVQADVFVSVHADSFIRPDARGSSVFALSERGATSAAARWLAKQENASDLIGGVKLSSRDPYLAKTLLDLSQTATINDSLKLGRAVLSEIGDLNTLHKNRVEQAGFAVLKAPDIPSILVETAFISNPYEERKLKDPDYQDRLARGIASGIKRYLAGNPPLAKAKVAAVDAAPSITRSD